MPGMSLAWGYLAHREAKRRENTAIFSFPSILPPAPFFFFSIIFSLHRFTRAFRRQNHTKA